MKKQFRNIVLYTLGNSVSALGSIIYSFAIGLYVLNTTGSGMKFAITLLVSFLPAMIMTPFAGVFADRFDKKKIVVLMDVLNSLLFMGFFVFILIFKMTLLSVYITAFLTNVITAFFSIAFEASKPQLVYKSHLQKLNAISRLIHAITAIIGPILGGLVYVLMDIQTFIILNGISFLLSAFTEFFIDFKFSSYTEISKEPLKFRQLLNSLNEGFLYLIKQKVIMSSYVLFVGINILMSVAIQVPLPYILNNHLKVGAKAYGIIFSFLPIGMIAGALIVGLVIKNIKTQKLFLVICLAAGILTIIMGLPYFFTGLTGSVAMIYTFFIAVLFVFGMMISLIDIPFSTLIQVEVDEKFLGRVWGILIPMIKVINPLGYILSGFLLELINPFLIPLVSGALFTILLIVKLVCTEKKSLKIAA